MNKISCTPAKRRTPVNEFQARFLAKVIRRLEEAWLRQFRPTLDLSLETYQRFRDLQEHEDFMDAALACGFVCADFRTEFPVETVHTRGEGGIADLSFPEIRHYIHTVQRAEKWNSEYSNTLWTALQSGSLGVVARRLASDDSLYARL